MSVLECMNVCTEGEKTCMFVSVGMYACEYENI